MRRISCLLLILICTAAQAQTTPPADVGADLEARIIALRAQARAAVVDGQLELAGRDIVDGFDDKSLSPDWDLEFAGTATGWKTEVSGSKLLVKQIEGKEGYAIVRLSRPVALSGEFKVSFKFEWTSKDVTPKNNRALQFLMLNLRKMNTRLVASHGYLDENANTRGSPVGAINTGADLIDTQIAKYKQIPTPDEFAFSLPASGKAEITIVRDAQGTIVSTFDGGGKKQVLTGTCSDTVAEVELEFRRFVRVADATFEGLAVDQVSVTGTSALRDKATATAVRDVLLKDERQRTDADRAVLDASGPRTMLSEADFERLLKLKQPALKTQLDEIAEPRFQSSRGAKQLQPAGRAVAPGGFVLEFAVSPDDNQLAVSGMRYLALVDTSTGEIKRLNISDPAENTDKYQIVSIRRAAKEKVVIRKIFSHQGTEHLDTLLIHDLTDGDTRRFPVTKKSHHTAFEPLSDDEYVVTSSSYGRAEIYHLERGLIAASAPSQWNALDVAVSPDEKTLVVGYEHGRVALYRMPTPEELAAATTENAFYLKSFAELTGHETEIWDVGFSPDGKYVASGDKEGKIWLWNVASQRAYVGIEGATFAFSPDSKLIASVDGASTGKKLGRRAAVWDVATGKALYLLANGHATPLIHVRFDSSSKRLYTTEGADIFAWDLP